MQELINQYVTEIILSILGFLVVLVKLWLEGLKKKAEAYFEAKTTTEQRAVLTTLAKEAFALAESAAKNLEGAEKLNKAVEYMTRKSSAYSIKITSEEARAVIEAAWLEDKRKELPVVELAELKEANGTQ